jgi:hypothetical protein
MAVELINALGKETGCRLPSTLVFHEPTIEALTDCLAPQLLGPDAQARAGCDAGTRPSPRDSIQPGGSGGKPMVEVVDPVAFAARAANILRSAWAPPCLSYSEDYLRWQFRFPGEPEAVASAAIVGGEPVAFLAVMPRRLRFEGRALPVHLMSFGATTPEHQGPISVVTYETLLSVLQDGGVPIVGFVEAGSAAERMLIAVVARSRYRIRSLGSYPVHAYRHRADAAVGAVAVEEATDLDEFLAVVARCDGPGVLWNAPDLRQLEHYVLDPRGRVLLIARDRRGEAVGAAMCVLSEVITRQGFERVTALDNLFLPEPLAEPLQALLADAAGRWRDRVTSTVITVPNPSGIPADVLRWVGLRATASRFNGLLFEPSHAAPTDALRTTLEVV